ncbi:MAG: metallopeptidase TldD-related protein [Pyrinomonadaceae bacterium]
MKFIAKIVGFFLLFTLFTLSALSQSKDSGDVILKAVQDEMSRTMEDLKFKEFKKPYFVEYTVEDEDNLEIESKYGAIISSKRRNNRTLYTQLRVGDYEFDNIGTYAGGFKFPLPMAIDDDYDSIRRSVWFATDFAYKLAINQLAAREAAKKDGEGEEEDDEDVPSFSKTTPVVSIEKPAKIEIDQAKWEKQVREWSKILVSYPELRESSISFYVRHSNRYLINSEGTRIVKPQLLITLNVYAKAVTSDNLRLTPSRHIYAKEFDEFPTSEEIDKTIKDLATDLIAISKAPQFNEKYIGPALFTDRAAIQLFHQLLSGNLERGGLAERLGRKVLPSFLSVTDDPTISNIGDYRLLGDYKIDDEGVPAKPLKLIENGVLKTLLTTRTPTKDVPESNGRARSGGDGSTMASISNLIIKSSSEHTFAELKQQLIDACKTQGLTYGILFREIDSTFAPGGGQLSVPILAYKVYVEDGREELITGSSVVDYSVRELRNILAAGNDAYPFSILVGNGHQGEGVPVSIVAPSVLVEEIYLRKNSGDKESPMVLTRP